MPRPRCFRRINFKPPFKRFGPFRRRGGEIIVLNRDELETIRLKDYLGMDQTNAAKKMEISQPTFNRILLSARKKISTALVAGATIIFSS